MRVRNLAAAIKILYFSRSSSSIFTFFDQQHTTMLLRLLEVEKVRETAATVQKANLEVTNVYFL